VRAGGGDVASVAAEGGTAGVDMDGVVVQGSRISRVAVKGASAAVGESDVVTAGNGEAEDDVVVGAADAGSLRAGGGLQKPGEDEADSSRDVGELERKLANADGRAPAADAPVNNGADLGHVLLQAAAVGRRWSNELWHMDG